LESFSNSGRVLAPDELSNLLTLDGKFESVIFRQTVQNISEKGLLAVVLFIRSLGEHADPATVTFTAADLIRGVQESSVACRVEVPLHFSRELAGELEIAGVITRTGSRAPITYRFTVPRMGDYLTILGLENEIQRLAKSTASL
jgi:hypothetical protein